MHQSLSLVFSPFPFEEEEDENKGLLRQGESKEEREEGRLPHVTMSITLCVYAGISYLVIKNCSCTHLMHAICQWRKEE